MTTSLIPLKFNGARERLFNIIDRRASYDELVLGARDQTGAEYLKFPNEFLDELPDVLSDVDSDVVIEGDSEAEGKGRGNGKKWRRSTKEKASGNTTSLLSRSIGLLGLGGQVLKVTTLLNKAAMDEVSRLLLAIPGVFESISLKYLKDNVKGDNRTAADDTEGWRQSIMVDLAGKPREFFLRALINQFVSARKLKIASGDALYETFYAAVATAPAVPTGPGRAATFLERTFETVKKEGGLRRYVALFASDRREIDSRRFTPAVQEGMLRYLETIGLTTDRDGFDTDFRDGKLDEYFAQAYHRALFADGSDGESSALAPGTALDSDFNLDTFEFTDEQGVVKENVLAASALAYFQILGDTLGIFPIVSALILRRARGRLDLPRGPGAERLQRYKRFLHTAPVTTEDRQLLYRRVFAEGEGELLPDTVVNEEFPELFHALMESAADFIRKEEANASERGDKISRGPIDEAVRNLQSNLSYFANDIAEDVLIIKEQFDLAFAILSDDDVIASCGVSRRGNPWSLIERLTQEELHSGRTVMTLRKLGVETYRVLQYVANFDVTTPEDQFREFLRSAEAVIMARGKIGDTPGAKKDDADAEEENDWDTKSDDEQDAENVDEAEDDWSK